MAAPNIWLLQTKRDVDGLIAALRYTDPSVRRGAVAALRALSAWQAVPALQAQLIIENDWQVHAAISAALQYLDHDLHVELMVKNRDVRGLTKMLNSVRHEDIITACEALGDLGDRHAAEPLIMVFRNLAQPAKVRLAAAEALIKLESAPAVVTLLAALRRNDWQVRRNAAAVLGQLKAVWATEPLINALKDPSPIVAKTAAAALKYIGTPEAVLAAKQFEAAQPPSEPAAQPRSSTSRLATRTQTGGLPRRETDKLQTTTVTAAPTERSGGTAPLPKLPDHKVDTRPLPPPPAPEPRRFSTLSKFDSLSRPPDPEKPPKP
ncbi:MAG: HEAT repeat domain-containing protein [Chloroflexi bacterium CFX4]|nr:HEAT repeat domain-containing protein [Chloroflexi bacterium CFX4]MDL1923829.1 HEAT repeat domain-containing protein [Chloroflexi bacterium CFX3]